MYGSREALVIKPPRILMIEEDHKKINFQISSGSKKSEFQSQSHLYFQRESTTKLNLILLNYSLSMETFLKSNPLRHGSILNYVLFSDREMTTPKYVFEREVL